MAEPQTDHGHEPSEQEHGAVRYERKDIRVRLVVILVLSAACFAAVDYFVIWQFFGVRKRIQEATNVSPFPNTPPVSSQLPPEPRLEQLNNLAAIKSTNVYDRLAAQEKILQSYGPTDDKGFVHIPIEQAIEAVAGHLRKQPGGGARNDSGLIDSGESNSGTMLRGGNP